MALNNAVLFITLLDLYVLPLVTFLGEFRITYENYETYHTRILFFERYVRRPTLTYSILAYTRILDPWHIDHVSIDSAQFISYTVKDAE